MLVVFGREEGVLMTPDAGELAGHEPVGGCGVEIDRRAAGGLRVFAEPDGQAAPALDEFG